MDESMRQQERAAREVLARLRRAFDAGVQALARRCAEGGKLDDRKLEEQQVASFELAWAAADLLAAETGIAAIAADSDALQTRLALIFTADAAVSVLDKLETVYAEASLDDAALRALRNDRM